MINVIKNFAFFSINGIRKIIYLFCLLFPIKKSKVFVNYFDGKGYGDNPKYIIEQLFKLNNDVQIIWIYRGHEDPPYNIKYVKPFSILAVYHQATSKIWISTVRLPYYSIKRSRQIYFQTWHGGLAFKKIEQECEQSLSSRYKRTCRHDSKMIDYYVSANADNTKLYKEKFWYSGGEILEVGSPRNDIFFELTEERTQKLKKQFNIKDEKIVVYAPTFRADNSFNSYNLDLNSLTSLLEKYWGEKWKLIVRLHPRLAGVSEKYVRYTNDIIDGSKISDIQELLAVTDFLITDYSSIALDYMILNRPVVIYASDIEDYQRDRDFHLRIEDTPFPIATNQGELENVIEHFNFSLYIDELIKFKERYDFFDTGNASNKIASMINELINS